MPPGIPGAVEPTQSDLELQVIEYPISPGDILDIQIEQLQARGTVYLEQVGNRVDNLGQVNIPVLGRVQGGRDDHPRVRGGTRARTGGAGRAESTRA